MAYRSRGWKRTGWTGNAAALAIMLLVLVPGLPADLAHLRDTRLRCRGRS